ncbi:MULTISPECIES: hypothetical protein [Sorangium]|uniref:Uncharacterized protein n=1 Tax=Sorangium cellulosum TaxID=56 RepID=A0A4P2R4B8_SORCE|nr:MULTISPECIES: hypothetical protein [Sorangium]AUX37461.1 uncharacterized protein SOCE836_096850 [Sorangium cellulosum]WCQ96751.1 hypothetical protein NQZ70_09538 [Sorangium sp. Soce836]
MANFEQNKPIETVENHVEITPTNGRLLQPGLHVFQLVVEDQAGNRSAPASIEVIIRDTTAPTAVLRLVVPQKENPDAWPEAGKPFELSAEGSSDFGGGPIVKYIWTLVSAPVKTRTPPLVVDPPLVIDPPVVRPPVEPLTPVVVNPPVVRPPVEPLTPVVVNPAVVRPPVGPINPPGRDALIGVPRDEPIVQPGVPPRRREDR